MEFLDRKFQKETDTTNTHLEFIASNSLWVSYKDHLHSIELLDSLYKMFLLQDANFASDKLRKLYEDISAFWNDYRHFLEKSATKRYLFGDFIHKYATLYNSIHSQMENSEQNKTYNQEGFYTFYDDIKELRTIYLKIFKSFLQTKKTILSRRFKRILNTYLYYFDLTMWDEAKKSKKITTMLHQAGVKEYSTKGYIEYKLKYGIPHKEDYAYLHKIYRNYL